MSVEAPELVTVPGSVQRFLDTAAASIVIDGERRPAASGDVTPVYDPGTGRVIAEVAMGGAEDIDAAVQSARAAFDDDWKHRTPSAQGRALMTLASLMEEHLDELAVLETLDVGKP